jgi:hypothetical protein
VQLGVQPAGVALGAGGHRDGAVDRLRFGPRREEERAGAEPRTPGALGGEPAGGGGALAGREQAHGGARRVVPLHHPRGEPRRAGRRGLGRLA